MPDTANRQINTGVMRIPAGLHIVDARVVANKGSTTITCMVTGKPTLVQRFIGCVEKELAPHRPQFADSVLTFVVNPSKSNSLTMATETMIAALARMSEEIPRSEQPAKTMRSTAPPLKEPRGHRPARRNVRSYMGDTATA